MKRPNLSARIEIKSLLGRAAYFRRNQIVNLSARTVVKSLLRGMGAKLKLSKVSHDWGNIVVWRWWLSLKQPRLSAMIRVQSVFRGAGAILKQPY